MKRDDAEEWMSAHGLAGEAWWRMSALGIRLGVPQALGIDRSEYGRRLGGHFRLPAPERREAVLELAGDGMSQREIADVLGVTETTVRRDKGATNGAPDNGEQDTAEPRATNVAPPEPAPHVTRNTGNDEWYTPPEYVHAARDVLGVIDLDPASSDAANRTVRAARYYTLADDGLAQPWEGRVWMNPPYSTGLVDRFVGRLLEAYQSKDVPAAVVLTNNATDTRWWQSLARRSSSVCCLAGRIRFRGPDGAVAGAGLQGQTIAYLGDDPSTFVERFTEYGVVL